MPSLGNDISPKNMQRTPPGWEDLMALAQANIGENRVGSESFSPVAGAIELLPDDELQANRYYSLGKIMCRLARHLRDTDTRADIVEVSAAGLVHDSRTVDPDFYSSATPAFRLNDLGTTPLSKGFSGVVRGINNELPRHERTVANLLTFETQRRDVISRDSSSANDFIPAGQLGEARLHLQAVANEATDAVFADIMSGTVAAYNMGYRKYFGISPHENPLVRPEELRRLDLAAASAQLASLHVTVFGTRSSLTGSRSCLDVTDSGELRVNPDTMSAEPLLDRKILGAKRTMHPRALGCPALYITGLIPTVGAMVPDIVERAEHIAGSHARATKNTRLG